MNIKVYSDGRTYILISDDDVYIFSNKNLFLKASKELQGLINEEPQLAIKFLSKYREIKNKKLFFKIIALLAKFM